MADHAHNLRARTWNTDGPVGVPTRGTTGYNRLRRSDRWTAHHPDIARRLSDAGSVALAVDVGYGASHTTTCEWARWLRRVNPEVAVVGVEIAPERVLPPREGVTFALGGFELGGRRAHLVRAFNVLRQYDVEEVEAAWELMRSRLHPGGVIIEGTCDELGRRSAWVTLTREAGPVCLTLAWDPHDVERPSDLAERLPKALIHLNTPGHAIHRALEQMDAAWLRAAAFAPFGPRVRWRVARDELLAQWGGAAGAGAAARDAAAAWRSVDPGLRIHNPRRRLSDNTLTLPWQLIAPGADPGALD